MEEGSGCFRSTIKQSVLWLQRCTTRRLQASWLAEDCSPRAANSVLLHNARSGRWSPLARLSWPSSGIVATGRNPTPRAQYNSQKISRLGNDRGSDTELKRFETRLWSPLTRAEETIPWVRNSPSSRTAGRMLAMPVLRGEL